MSTKRYRVGEWSCSYNGFELIDDESEPLWGPLGYFPLAVDANHVCDALNARADLSSAGGGV